MRNRAVVFLLFFVVLFAGDARPNEIEFTGVLEEGDETLEETHEFSDTYEVRLVAGEFVDVSLTSEEFDTYLIIVPPEGDQMSVDDYYTDDTNAAMLFVAREAGIYEFVVTSHRPGETGSYRLHCTTTQTHAEAVHEGELTEGDPFSWKGGEYYDRYELELGANDTRILSLDSDDFNTYLAIHTPQGEVWYVYGFPTATTLEAGEEGGTYTIIVTSMDTRETGAYRLEILSAVD